MVTGLWPPCGDERSMYSLVAQLVEHLKLNQEVPGSLPGWGIMIFFSSQGKQTVRAIYCHCHCDNPLHGLKLKTEYLTRLDLFWDTTDITWSIIKIRVNTSADGALAEAHEKQVREGFLKLKYNTDDFRTMWLKNMYMYNGPDLMNVIFKYEVLEQTLNAKPELLWQMVQEENPLGIVLHRFRYINMHLSSLSKME